MSHSRSPRKGRAPDLVDRHIGSRIRLMRTLRGMTQAQLGAALDLTFQQVQKYELGHNRVSGSTLYRLSRVLDVPIAFFFDAMDGAPSAAVPDCSGSREALILLRAFDSLSDDLRGKLIDLVKAMAREG